MSYDVQECRACGKMFEPQAVNEKYCSDDCRQAQRKALGAIPNRHATPEARRAFIEDVASRGSLGKKIRIFIGRLAEGCLINDLIDELPDGGEDFDALCARVQWYGYDYWSDGHTARLTEGTKCRQVKEA